MLCCLIFQLPHWYHSWVLHAAARTVLDRRPCGHVTMALQELHWLPVTERIQYKLLCLMVHQSLLGHMPVCISDLLTSVPTIPAQSALRALLSGDLVVQWTRQRIGDKAFSVATLQTWNRLPRELRLLRSTTTFRCQLKTFLFQSAPVYGHRDTDWWLFCDAPSVFGRGHNTSDSVTAETPCWCIDTWL